LRPQKQDEAAVSRLSGVPMMRTAAWRINMWSHQLMAVGRAMAIVLLASSSADAQTQTPAPAQTQTPPPPQTMSTTIAPWWRMIEYSFVSAAEEMPADKWSFKPSGGTFEKARTFAQQVKHVACSNEGFFNEIAHKDPPPDCENGGPNPAQTKDELLAYLRTSFERGRQAIAELTPANALEYAGGRYGGDSTRLGLITLAVWHASDHYGQLVIYLRMNNIVPPASR
jgi:uncharacterized damage-inducible protein DinB